MSSPEDFGIQPSDKEKLELFKLRTEAEKARAERDKILDDLKQSKSVLAWAGKVFTPLVAALTITFGYLAATHSQRVAEADLKAAQARMEKTQADLEKQRIELDKTVAQRDLASAQVTLKDTKSGILIANAARQKADSAEKASQERLKALQTEYANLQAQQGEQIVLGSLRKLIDILDSEPTYRQTADSRYIEDIRKEVAGDGQYRPARLRYLMTAAQSNGLRPGLRGLLYYSLFKVTDDSQWIDHIERLASQDFSNAGETFSSLLRLKYFSSKDRENVACGFYERYRYENLPTLEQVTSETENEYKQRQLLQEEVREHLLDLQKSPMRGGTSPLLRCRVLYIDHLHYVREFWPKESFLQEEFKWHEYWQTSHVTLQAAAIWYLKDHPQFDPKSLTGNLLSDVSVDAGKMLRKEGAPEDMIAVFKSGSAKEWLDQNAKLVNFWTSPSFSELESSSDATMNKIFSGAWLTPADLP
jgi:hypothetical protein